MQGNSLEEFLQQDGDLDVILEAGQKVPMREAARRCRMRLGYTVKREREGAVEEKRREMGGCRCGCRRSRSAGCGWW